MYRYTSLPFSLVNHCGLQPRSCILRACRCRCSSRSFSEFAFSYSPFSKHLWSGLSRESVGGNFSCQPGVSSFKVRANRVKLYLVGSLGGLLRFQSK
nr:hypothetical protein Iba_chr13bCG7930 [Ipomoea batatas]GMD78160.1 hypothetical protein Iba_chr13cCG10290 [Ipomoea batatas]GMD82108.1 hypothetical protein Iba_chr13fCG4880 [Ipomoea batatas]